MTDLIYGRGITDLIREMPFYVNLLAKYANIKFFHAKTPIYGSADIINVCNLHCTHCYWWLNRKDDEELSAEQWREVITKTFKKQKVTFVTLVGGEPMMRPDVIKIFCDEMPRRVCVVTNGTFPLRRFDNLYFYWLVLLIATALFSLLPCNRDDDTSSICAASTLDSQRVYHI